MTDRKKIAFIFIILLFFTPLVSANNDNIIFLKAGHIDTDLETGVNVTEPDVMAVNINSEVPDSSYKYYLVQFDDIVQPEWKDAVETTGAEILDYVPDNTFVLKMNETVKSQVESLEFVRWVGEYLPEYKYVEEEKNSANVSFSTLTNSANSTMELLVILFEGEDNQQIIKEINQINGIVIDNSYQTLKIELPENNIEELTEINGISWIEEYHTPTVFNDVAANIMNVSILHANVGLNGSGQIVAVCDTGLDTGVNDESMHADIRGRILQIIDYSNDGALDYAGHGTHVVGSILGNGSMSGGQYKGMAPEASLVFQAVQNNSDSTNEMSGVPSDLSTLLQSAYDKNAKIHSNSWGDSSSYGKYTAYSAQVDQFIWNNPDMVVVFAAGNSGPSTYSISSPATAKNCIAVGASESNRTGVKDIWGNSYDSYTDNIDEVATFSSRGPTIDNRIKPDVVAPGTCIVSTRSSLATYEYINILENTNYAYLSGTSMATPLVSGSIALIREYYLTEEKLENISAALLKATLINGAYDISQETEIQYDNSQGWGRVDVANSIISDYPEVIVYYDGISLSKNESWTHTYNYIESGEPLRATLVWTDYPAFEGTTKALVNDLDFTINDSSDIYYGNGGSDFDRTNNVEGIELSSVSDENYTFNVTAHSVNEGGSQPFALVASFTCDNNEFPAPGTQADSKNTAVSTDVVHPQGVDYDSIIMKINNSPVSFTSTPITDGYSITYNSASSYQTGEYNVSVTASTETGQEFSYSWNFTVDAETSNIAPVLSAIGNKTVSESYPLEIELSATDADNDTLTFGTNASFGVLNGNTFTWTPDYNDAGSYSVEFNVTDNTEVDSEIIRINVINMDRKPVLDTIGNASINENESLSFTISATDPDTDDVVSYSIEGKPDGAVFDSSSGQFTWTPDYDASGSYNVKFIASSNTLNDSETITITVLNVDRPVKLDPVDDITVNETEVIDFIVAGSDPDKDKVTYSVSALPGNSSFDSESGNFHWVTGYNDSGSYEIEFTATANGTTDSELMTITINNVDRPPELATIGNKIVDENSTLMFTLSATDADGDDITYSASSLPDFSAFDSVSGTFEWTPLYNQSGIYDVEFIAFSNGLTDSQNVSITVSNVDRAPVLGSIGSKSVSENQTLNFNISATDLDGDDITYSANDLPQGAIFNTSSGNFTWTPGYGSSGSYNVEFIASSNSLHDSETVTIYVGDVDRPPVLKSIGSKSIDENKTLTFTISATDPDADDVVSYSLEGKPDGAVFNSSTGQFTWTPDYQKSGSYNVKFIASSNALNDSETITITVLNVDRLVELDPVDDVIVNETEVIDFIVTGSDPDGDKVTYSVSDHPGNSSFDGESGNFHWVTGYNDSGTYEIEFTATANGTMDSESMTITVNNVDRKPELAAIGSKTVNENSTLTFTVSATDADDDAITYYASSSDLPEGYLFDSSTGMFEWTTDYSDAGNYNINFTAIANGLIDYENVSISVVNVNAPPQFNTISSQTVLVNEDLQFTVNATDIDNDNLTYSADSIPEGAEFNATNLLFNWTPMQNQTGNYYANFTVTDSHYYDNLNVSITVTNTTVSAVTTSSAAGGGGGGGGGGGTAEEFENIAVKDVSSLYVGNDMDVVFDFRNVANDIRYVEYKSLKNAGSISVTVEVLVDKSALVDSLPSGIVYRNINIWVGKTGYAIEENIANPVIGFRVDRNWIENNNIDPDSIVLNRYNGGWRRLSTSLTDSDENYLYFEAATPGFSPFAITGEAQVIESNLNSVDSQFSPEDSEPVSNVTSEETKPENTLNAVSGLISFLILTFVCFLHRKQ